MSYKFNPTQEQLDIVKAFNETRVLKINACSGSGKTSTLELLAEANPKPSLLLAFNKAIADEASRRFPSHVYCRTMNSVAYAEFGRPLQHKLNANNNPKINTMRSLKNIVDWFGLDEYPSEPPLNARVVASLARDTLDRFCYSAHKDISEKDILRKDFKELAKKYSFDNKHLSKVVVNLAKLIWKERINPFSTAAATHDTYVKLWSLSNPVINYDIIYVDESQDINACVLHVLQHQTCKVLYVGDTHQSIYAFRGAVNAMEDIIAPTMYLSQSWRYGDTIAKVAECILKKDGALIRGNPNVNSVLTDIEPTEPHTAIFRTNAGLLSYAEELMDKGVSISIEINVKDFTRQVESILELRKGGKPFHDNIARFGSFDELVECSKEDVEIKRLLHTAQRVDVFQFLDKLESNRTAINPTVILTTAHKSKGLEFENVVIAEDFKFSTGNDLLDIPEQELNLLYVAATRAKKKLQLPLLFGAYFEDYINE